MFRLLIGVIAAAALTCAARADDKAIPLDPAVTTKTSSAKTIAGALAASANVRVIVTVRSLSGRTADQLTTAARVPATRAATKQEIASAIDAVLSSHKLAHVGTAKGAPAIVRLTTTPAFSALVDAAELTALAKDPRVVAIEYDRPMTKQLAATLPLIGMPAVHAVGGIGTGYAVAVIDDGVQRNHQFLGVARLFSGREGCFLDTNNCPNGTNEQIATGAAAAQGAARHGTHVSGIVLGNRPAVSGTPNKGVAPAARLVPINIFGPNSSVSTATIQRGFEYVEDLVLENAGGNPLKIAAINMSVGGGASAGICDADPAMQMLKPVIDNLRSRKVLPVVAAGNEGRLGEMGFPACLSTIVSVAATSRTGVVASYSNISPSTDLFAPGGETNGDCVVSSVAGNTFDALCGTSMAAPHVAGAAATLRQLAPTASACRIEDALKATGLATPDTRSGGTIVKPRIRVNQARARLLAPVAPANNNFAAATVVPANATQFTTEGTNVAAALETGERRHVVATSSRSVWWKWTPSFSGSVTIDTRGSGFDTVLSIYRGATSVTSLGTLVTENDDDVSAGVKTSRVTFSAVAGQTYHLAVAGKTSAEECSVTLNITRPPANDNFASATVVTVPSTQQVGVSGSTIFATKETGEPAHFGGNPNHTTSVWHRFTAPVTGLITLDTNGSSLDTVLAVYTGSALNALSSVASNDDYTNTSGASRVTFYMTAGQTYRVAVAGFAGAQGKFRLWFTPAGAQNVVRASLAND